MFAFDRSAFAVLAPLALLAFAVAASNYSPAPQPAQAAAQQPQRLRDSQKADAVIARNDAAATRH